MMSGSYNLSAEWQERLALFDRQLGEYWEEKLQAEIDLYKSVLRRQNPEQYKIEFGDDDAPDILQFPPSASVVPNGFFSVIMQPGERRQIFRIYTRLFTSTFAPGKRIIAVLIGDNVDSLSDYEPFGFVYDNGIVVWQKYQRRLDLVGYAAVIWDRFQTTDWRRSEVVTVDKRCLVCNHKLKNDVSWRRGVGDTCYKKLVNKQPLRGV